MSTTLWHRLRAAAVPDNVRIIERRSNQLTHNSRRLSVSRPILFYLLLLAFLLSTVSGLTAPAPKSTDSSKANKVYTPATVPMVAGNFVPDASETEVARKARVQESYSKLPLSFEANEGQTDGRFSFVSRGSGYSLFLARTEAVLRIADRGSRNEWKEGLAARPMIRPSNPKSAVLSMKFVNGTPAPEMVGVDQLPGKSNYFIGNDPAKWQTNIPNYAKVKYEGVYPGVDLVYYGNQQHLGYDFVVAPGADPTAVKLALEGVRKMRVDARGDLVLRIGGGGVRWEKPIMYQEIDGVRREVSGSYVVKAPRQVGFLVGAYDPSRPLIIDPALVYSTYLGGSGGDVGYGIPVDDAGSAHVTGYTPSTNFPTTPSAIQTTNARNYDAFVTKLEAPGSALVYSTYLGGSVFDVGVGIAVDGAGSAFVTGQTPSTNFPTTAGAVQTTNAGSYDAFVTKLDATGSALVYSTYLGGSSYDYGLGIAVDKAGSAYVTGYTLSTNFPTTAGAVQTTNAGSYDAFVTKLNPTGSALVYSTYLGGSDFDFGFGIAVDGADNAYVAGYTSSANFPTTPGAVQTTNAGSYDAFVTKLDAAGST